MKKKLLEIITRHLAPPARLAAFLLAASAASGAWAADAATISVSGSTVTIANETATQYANKDLTFNSTWQGKTFTLPSGTDLVAGTVVKITSISFAKATSTSGTMADKLKIDGWVSASATVTASGFVAARADKYTYSFTDSPVYMVAGAGKVVKFLNSDGTEKNTLMGFCCGANSYQYIQDLKWTVSSVPYVPVIEVVAEIIATQNGARTSIGNDNSSNPLALCGVTGWLDTANSKNEAIVLENGTNDYAVAVNDANSVSEGNEQHSIWKKLSGSGKLTVVSPGGDKSGTYPVLDIYDASEFTGSIAIGGVNKAPNLGVLFCNENETLPETRYQLFRESVTSRIYVSAGRTTANNAAVTVPAGKTWSATGGIKVMGELIVSDGATAPSIGSGSTGTVAVLSGTGTVKGIASDDVKLMTVSGSTLAVADTSSAYITIPADSSHLINAGTLDFSGCTALAALNLYVGTGRSTMLGTITLPANAGVNVIVAKSANDGDTVSVAMTAISGANYYVVDTDGSYYDATVAQDGSNLVFTPTTLKIDGVATAYDVDFAYTGNPLQYKTSSGATLNNVTQVESDWYNYSAADKTTGLKVNKTPYIGGISEFSSLQQKMTLAVVGQMPSVQDNAIFIHLGGSSGSNKGFLIYRLAEDDKVAVAYNVGHDVTDLTTMTVPNAATARHVYIITKVDDTTANKSVFTIYLDGIKWKTQEVSPVLSMTGGVQIGSDFQAQIRTSDQANGMRIKRVMPSGADADTAVDTTGYVNVIRIYDRILTKAEIDQYSAPEEYPYVSPHGSSARTFDTANEAWVEDGATDWANTYEKTTTHAEAPRAGSALTVKTSVATTISANLESTVSYDSLTVNGTGATFAKVNGYGGVISVAGSSVIGAPVTINAGALVLGGPVTITEGGSVTFNYSDYEVASADVIQLTGEMEEAESGKITITPPADQHYTYTYGYSGTQYVITPTLAVAVLNHGGTLTGYTTADTALAEAVSGDTVTLQTAYLTPGTHATYAGDKTGVNVVVQGYTIAPAVADGTTTWSTSSYIWTGEGADTNWTTPANWSLASGYPGSSGSVTTTPTDNVVIDTAATINVNATVYVWGITMNADVKFTSTNNGQFFLERTYGTGKMSLGGITLNVMRNGRSDRTYGKLVIENNVEVCAETVNTITIYKNSDNNYASSATINGNLSGSGELRVDVTGTSGTGLYNYNRGLFLLGSDNSGFSGKFAVVGVADATSVVSGSANAEWSFNTYSRDGYAYATRGTGITEYYFGSLSGTLDLNGNASSEVQKYNMTIHVGGKNEDCTFGGRMGRSDKGFPNTFIKEGTADCTYTGTEIGNLQLQNGTFIIGNSNALNSRTSLIFTGGALSVAQGLAIDPVSKFSSSSTAAVVFDDRGYDNEWATALTAANTPYGLTKKGAGTLTLSAATATIGGATTVSKGILVVPVGTTFNGAVTVAEGAKIQFEADPNWTDGATPTICTFTTAPSADTLDRIEITGFGGRQAATMEYKSETGAYVATVTSPTLVWNGADGANWGDADAWLVDGAAATFMSGDKVSFPDSLFTGETTELTVNVGADVDPVSITIAPGTGHTYKFTGTGKVTTADLVVAATGAGTVKLAADVFSELEIETAGMVTVAAGEGTVTLATVTSSSDSTALKVSSGSLTLTEGLGCVIQNDSTLILDGTFNLNKTITGTSANAELIIRGTIDRTQNGLLQWLNGYPGKFKLENNATLKYYFRNSGSHYQNRNMFGNGAVEFAGGTIYQVHANSPQDAEPINDVTLVDNTTTTISRQDGTAVLRFKGTFDGNGTLEGDASMVLALTDASEFGGAVSWTHSSSSTANNIETATATSADATYNVTGAPASATQLIGLNFSGTAEMGAFNVSSANAQVGVNNANVELEIGAKANSASTLNGQFITNPLTLTKVGANSTLTLGSGFSAVSGSTIDVQAGTLTTEALTLSGQTLTVGANATATATGDLVLEGGTLNVNGTVNIGNSTVPLWLKADNSAVINVNAGGNLNLCRVTANGDYTMNFNGGTLTEYGAGWRNEYLLGGADADDASATITLNVKAGGLTVDTATATTITPVLAGDAESVGGGLTKKGAGTLTLAKAPKFTGAITVEAGSVVLPAGSYTLGANTIVSARGDGTMTLAYATTVELTVPTVANTTVEVTAGGETVTGVNGVYTVPVGVEVTVTYTGTNGNVVTAGGTITGTYHEATTVNTTGVTVASAAVWTGNGADIGWTTADNWSTGSVPDENTPVEFPNLGGSAYTVWIGTGSKCGTLQVDGDVTFAQWEDSVTDNQSLELHGNVTGSGTLTLGRAGLWNNTGSTITVAQTLDLVIADVRNGENALVDSWLSGSAIQVDGDVDIRGRMYTWDNAHVFNGAVTVQWFTANGARVVFNGDITLKDGSYFDNYSGLGWEFNGITVTALGNTGALFYNGAEVGASVTGTGVTFAGRNKFNTAGEAVPVISAPAVLKSGATVSMMNNGTITTYSAETVNHAVEVSADGSYKVYTCVIPQANAPAIDMTESSPVTVTTSGVTFAVAADSLIEGLYYRVKAVDGEGNESAAASTEKVKYTGDNTSALNFTAPLPTDGVLYYTIEASDSAE